MKTNNTKLDIEAVYEIQLYLENDCAIYNQLKRYEISLEKRLKAKTFDYEKALKGYMNIIEYGLKRYVLDFGGTWFTLLNTTERKELAKILYQEFIEI